MYLSISERMLGVGGETGYGCMKASAGPKVGLWW